MFKSFLPFKPLLRNISPRTSQSFLQNQSRMLLTGTGKPRVILGTMTFVSVSSMRIYSCLANFFRVLIPIRVLAKPISPTTTRLWTTCNPKATMKSILPALTLAESRKHGPRMPTGRTVV